MEDNYIIVHTEDYHRKFHCTVCDPRDRSKDFTFSIGRKGLQKFLDNIFDIARIGPSNEKRLEDIRILRNLDRRELLIDCISHLTETLRRELA